MKKHWLADSKPILLDNEIAEAVEVKDKRWTEMSSIGVIKKIYEADLIINMPTLKRYTMTNLTCALKNMMGVLDVPTTNNMHLWGDANKAVYESTPREKVVRRICLTIAEADMAVNPEMTIIDARTVLCKDHLSFNTGEPQEANRIIISGDSLAADIYASKLLKEVYEPYELGFTKDTFEYAAKLGLSIVDPDKMVLKDVEV